MNWGLPKPDWRDWLIGVMSRSLLTLSMACLSWALRLKGRASRGTLREPTCGSPTMLATSLPSCTSMRFFAAGLTWRFVKKTSMAKVGCRSMRLSGLRSMFMDRSIRLPTPVE